MNTIRHEAESYNYFDHTKKSRSVSFLSPPHLRCKMVFATAFLGDSFAGKKREEGVALRVQVNSGEFSDVLFVKRLTMHTGAITEATIYFLAFGDVYSAQDLA